jgi:hypothetical protein
MGSGGVGRHVFRVAKELLPTQKPSNQPFQHMPILRGFHRNNDRLRPRSRASPCDWARRAARVNSRGLILAASDFRCYHLSRDTGSLAAPATLEPHHLPVSGDGLLQTSRRNSRIYRDTAVMVDHGHVQLDAQEQDRVELPSSHRKPKACIACRAQKVSSSNLTNRMIESAD